MALSKEIDYSNSLSVGRRRKDLPNSAALRGFRRDRSGINYNSRLGVKQAADTSAQPQAVDAVPMAVAGAASTSLLEIGQAFKKQSPEINPGRLRSMMSELPPSPQNNNIQMRILHMPNLDQFEHNMETLVANKNKPELRGLTTSLQDSLVRNLMTNNQSLTPDAALTLLLSFGDEHPHDPHFAHHGHNKPTPQSGQTTTHHRHNNAGASPQMAAKPTPPSASPA